MNKIFWIIIFFLFPFTDISSQLVNVESMRMHTDSVRKVGNASFSFSYQENNSISLLVFKTGVAAQLKSKSLKDIFMFIGNIDLSKTTASDLSNSAFGHIRYNRKFSTWFRWEVFSQVQYNKVLNVGMRLLNGSGPRFKWMNKENAAGYFGCLYMFEYEETSGIDNLINKNHRMSSYLTVSLSAPKSKSEFISTTYFQPRLDKWNDYRFMQQVSLAFQIGKKIKMTTGFNFLFDSFPPIGVDEKALSIEQGIRIDL